MFFFTNLINTLLLWCYHSKEGWKVSKKVNGDYIFAVHGIYGTSELTHYNHKSTCLNWYNSTIAQTKRDYEIQFPYDFLMIGLRFWMDVTTYKASDYYAIRIANDTNYYWISNANTTCDPSEDAYSQWYHVGLDIENISGSTGYCYQDVLMYFDPSIDPTS